MRSGHPDTIFHCKKNHKCSWCDEQITKGSAYIRWANFDSDTVDSVKMHPECMDALDEWRDMNPGEIEFFPGEFQRGKTE